MGTNPDLKGSKNEGSVPPDSNKHAQKRQMGTNTLISNNKAKNEQKQDPIDQASVEDSQDEHANNENISNNKEDNNDMHNDKSDGTNDIRDDFEPKLVPKSSEQQDSDDGIRFCAYCEITNRIMSTKKDIEFSTLSAYESHRMANHRGLTFDPESKDLDKFKSDLLEPKTETKE